VDVIRVDDRLDSVNLLMGRKQTQAETDERLSRNGLVGFGHGAAGAASPPGRDDHCRNALCHPRNTSSVANCFQHKKIPPLMPLLNLLHCSTCAMG
jgi:hypothetical protein